MTVVDGAMSPSESASDHSIRHPITRSSSARCKAASNRRDARTSSPESPFIEPKADDDQTPNDISGPEPQNETKQDIQGGDQDTKSAPKDDREAEDVQENEEGGDVQDSEDDTGDEFTDNGDGESPFLVARWLIEAKSLADLEVVARTPTRSRRGRTADLPSSGGSNRLKQPERNDESQDEFALDVLKIRRVKDVHVLSDEEDEEGLLDGNRTPLPKTPSKTRRSERDRDSILNESPKASSSWLDSWKYNINMTHSIMRPPMLDEYEADSTDVSSPIYLPAGLGLATPKRRRTKTLLHELDFKRFPVSPGDWSETFDVEEPQDFIPRSTKRLAADEEGQEEEEEEEEEEEQEGEEPYGLTGSKKQPLLDLKALKRTSLTPIRQLSSAALHTPPQKRVHEDLLSMKPPPPPRLSLGNMPMYYPHDGSFSPSRRRKRSDMDIPSFPQLHKRQ